MPADYRHLLRQAWQAHLALRADNAPVAVSLFAGAGGSALGLSMAGCRIALAVEQDLHAVACLRLNFQNMPRTSNTALFCGDVRSLAPDAALELAGLRLGQLDLLEASPPCQGFSRAGKRRAHDPRNELLHEVLPFVDGFMPKALVMENVDSLLQQPGRRILAPFLQALRRRGYRVRVWLLNAVWYNVPQRRVRCLLLALRQDVAPGALLLPPASESWPRSLAAAIADLPAFQRPETGHIWVDESPAGRNTRTWQLAAAAPQGARYAGHQRRLRWDAPAPTITACHDGKHDKRPYLRNMHCHPLWTRTLSLAECKRVASFPDAFALAGQAHPKHWHRGVSRLGNAVPPLFMRAVARRLLTLTGDHAHV